MIHLSLQLSLWLIVIISGCLSNPVAPHYTFYRSVKLLQLCKRICNNLAPSFLSLLQINDRRLI